MSTDKQNEVSFICKSCGAKLNVDVSQVVAICDHCGNSVLVSELLNESDAVKVQKIKSQAYKDVEMGKQQLEAEKIKIASEKEKQQAETSAVEKFKKSKFSKVLIAFTVISALMCAVAFNNNRILAGLVALVQIALFGISWLMGMQIIKEKKNGIRVIAAVVAFVLFIPYFNLSNAADNKGTPFEWNDIVLSEMLPTPDSTVGEIHSNSQTELMLDVHGISEAQFNDYIDACKEKGFTIEADLSGISFSAYNQDGYKLSLSYYESSSELSINIDAPMEMSQIQWPSSDVAKLLPVPKSNIGSISWENSGGFVIYISNTTKAEYNEYVNACSAKGFNVDYNKGDDYYYADNADGYHVSLRYEGNNVMWIRADEPEAEEHNNTTSSTTDSTNSTTDDSNSNQNETITPFVESEAIKNLLFSVSSWDTIKEDSVKSSAENKGLEVDIDMGWGGTSWQYYFSDAQNEHCYLMLFFVHPQQENYAEHLKYFTLTFAGADDVYLHYYSSWNRDNDDDGKYGFYVGDTHFDDLESAYNYYLSLVTD